MISILLFILSCTYSKLLRNSRVLQSTSATSTTTTFYEVEKISDNQLPTWEVDSTKTDTISVKVLNKSISMVKVNFINNGVANEEDEMPWLAPAPYSRLGTEWVKFNLSEGQPIVIGGINLDPMSYSFDFENYYAFRVSDHVCSSMQYSLTLG